MKPKKHIFRDDGPAGNPQIRSSQTKFTYFRLRPSNIFVFIVRE
jgi:hypothetical protein